MAINEFPTGPRRWLITCAPRVSQLSAEEEVKLLIRKYGVDEREARLMVGLERGELTGDTFDVAPDDESWYE